MIDTVDIKEDFPVNIMDRILNIVLTVVTWVHNNSESKVDLFEDTKEDSFVNTTVIDIATEPLQTQTPLRMEQELRTFLQEMKVTMMEKMESTKGSMEEKLEATKDSLERNIADANTRLDAQLDIMEEDIKTLKDKLDGNDELNKRMEIRLTRLEKEMMKATENRKMSDNLRNTLNMEDQPGGCLEEPRQTNKESETENGRGQDVDMVNTFNQTGLGGCKMNSQKQQPMPEGRMWR